VNNGLDADVVTMNTAIDIDFLAVNGVVVKDGDDLIKPINSLQKSDYFGSISEPQKVHFKYSLGFRAGQS
jgi:ABC-type sulfate transport system substrate-binding protein